MKQNNAIIQFVKYFFVGLLATLVEWVGFYLSNNVLHIHYLLATAIAFFFSTFANWGFGRIIMFKGTGNTLKEIIKIYAVSIVGLAMNLILMYLMVDAILMDAMLSKVVATALVFMWNFLIRRFVIYKNK